MGELGELLRKAREAKGLSLEQAEEGTRIRSAYLQALEEENYERLPPAVYVKGFLRNYAVYLGLDPEQVLFLYRETQPPAATATPAPVMLDEPLVPLASPRLWPIAVVLLIIALAALGWWGYQRYYAGALLSWPFAPATATPTATSVPPTATPLPPTATPSPTWTVTPTPTPTPTPAGLELRVEIVGQRSWLLVQADGDRVFAGILEPGAKYTWTARERIILRSGWAGAVLVTLNGQELGLLGKPGEVVEKEWTAPGVPTRTPVPAATP